MLKEKAGGEKAWLDVWRMFPKADRKDRLLMCAY